MNRTDNFFNLFHQDISKEELYHESSTITPPWEKQEDFIFPGITPIHEIFFENSHENFY